MLLLQLEMTSEARRGRKWEERPEQRAIISLWIPAYSEQIVPKFVIKSAISSMKTFQGPQERCWEQEVGHPVIHVGNELYSVLIIYEFWVLSNLCLVRKLVLLFVPSFVRLSNRHLLTFRCVGTLGILRRSWLLTVLWCLLCIRRGRH